MLGFGVRIFFEFLVYKVRTFIGLELVIRFYEVQIEKEDLKNEQRKSFGQSFPWNLSLH